MRADAIGVISPSQPRFAVGLAVELAVGLVAALSMVACAPPLPELAEIPHPPVDSMERRVRERTLELKDALVAARGTRDAYLVASASGTLGRHYHAHELYDAARVCYENATRLEPDVASWHYLIGVVAQAQGDLDLAIEAFGEALSGEPTNALTRVRLAEVRLGRAQPAEAEAVLADLPEEHGVALAHFFSGQAHALLGRPGDALAAYRRALDLQPDADSVYYEMAQAARAAGDGGAADRYLELRGETEITIDDPLLTELNRLNVGAVAHLRRGARAQIAGEWDEALRYYRLAVDADPSNPEARQSLAGVLARRSETDEAIEHYRAALARDPSALPRTNLAGLLVQRGQVEEALGLVEEALALDPEAEHPRRVRAAALVGAGQYDKAVTAYKGLLDLDADRAEFHLGYARALAGRGDQVGALRAVDRSIELTPADLEARFVRANLLGQSRRYREAAADYSQVTSRVPNHTPAWLGEITAWTLAGDLSRALERVDAALEAVPGDTNLIRARDELTKRSERVQ